MTTLTNNPIQTVPFGTMKDRQKLLNMKTIKDIVNIGSIATLFFIVADFVPLYIKWTSVQQDNWYFVALLAAVSAVILDLPMFLGGRVLREYQDGLRTKQSMISIVLPATIAFLIAYIPFLIFSFATKDATFEEALPLGSASAISFDTTLINEASNPFSVSIAAIFSAVLPLGTSIASLVVGLCTYNPVKERLNKLEKVKLLAQEHKTCIVEGMAQITDRMNLLKAREQDLFANFIKEIKAQEQIRIQAYEEALEEALDAEGILRVTDNAFQILESSGFSDECPVLTMNELTDPVLEESKGITTLLEKSNSSNKHVA